MLFFSVDATFSNLCGRFVNDATGHKRNASLEVVFVNKRPHIALFAARNICKGEEIRYDYGVIDLPWRRKQKVWIYLTLTCAEIEYH